MPNSLVWADVPVLDIQRASAFYSKMLGVEVTAMPGQSDIGLIPSDNGISVDLALNAGTRPSSDSGPTIYFTSQGDIDGMLQRVVDAGGRILAEKQFMGPMIGWIAFVLDTEGNRIGIQQPAEDKGQAAAPEQGA